jgi:3-dehydroquinate synthetase
MEPYVRHGQAVTLEILTVTMIARQRGLIATEDRDRIVGCYRACGLTLWHPILGKEPARLADALADTKLHRGGHQRIIVPCRRIGNVADLELTSGDIARGIDELYECVAGEQ